MNGEFDTDGEFAKFYDSSFAHVMAYMIVMTRGNRPASEEATQQAFVEMFQHWWERRDWEETRKVSYTIGIAAKIWYDTHRTFWRRAGREAGYLLHRGAAPLCDVETSALASEAVRHMRRLPPRERAVALLYFVADLSTAEIAERLGTSESTVRNHVLHVRRKLRAALGDGGTALPVSE